MDDEFYSSSYRFVSDWNGTHPFTGEYEARVRGALAQLPDVEAYRFYDREPGVVPRIVEFHHALGEDISEDRIAPGDGSSPLLSAIWLWARATGLHEVRYVPPLYYTAHHLLNLLELRPRPVSGLHAFEQGCSLNLPSGPALLYLADPVWYAGRRARIDVIRSIAEWQQRTHGFVVVDGSFQYMPWEGPHHEASAELDPERTIRIVCPTKSLGMHGYRFAYAIVPPALRRPLLDMYETIHGSTSRGNVAFARAAMEILASPTSNRPLTSHIARRFGELSKLRAFNGVVEPECGYFVFAEPTRLAPDALVMTGEHFENPRFKHFVRVNLLNERALGALVEGEGRDAGPVETEDTSPVRVEETS